MGVSPRWVKVEGREEERKKKVGENNGQLRFVRHHGWRTQAAWTKKCLMADFFLVISNLFL